MAKENHQTFTLRCYFSNIWAALLGRNPFLDEMERMRKTHEKNIEEMLALKNSYCDCVDVMDGYVKQIAEGEKKISSLQKLVEDLRERVREKEQLVELVQQEDQQRMEQMMQNLLKRIETYSNEIDKLKAGEKSV